MIVSKFGGTSLRDAEYMRKALAIAIEHIGRTQHTGGRAVIVVASAMRDTTNRINALLACAIDGNDQEMDEQCAYMRAYHLQTLQEALGEGYTQDTAQRIEELCDSLYGVAHHVHRERTCDIWQRAHALSHGELLSTALLSAIATHSGIDTALLDSRELIRTLSEPLNAQIKWEPTAQAIQRAINRHAERIYIAQGFIGSDDRGRTTTFSRGGSDYTASIYAAAMDAERFEIWTDVNGVMTTDPRYVQTASTIPEISYNEAAELAYFGARVIHPSTMLPAIEKDIPLIVGNTADPHGPRTTISKSAHGSGVRAIAFKQGISVVNIQSYRMLNAHGFLNEIFKIFSQCETAVDLIATSEVSLSLTIDNPHALDRIEKKLQSIARVDISRHRTIVCLVGYRLWRNAPLIADVFQILKHVPIEVVSLGASDTNLSLVVHNEQALDAVTRLHRHFFEHDADSAIARNGSHIDDGKVE